MKISIIAALATIAAISTAMFPQKLDAPEGYAEQIEPLPVIELIEIEPIKPMLTHEQEVWLYALEWCESRGVKTAINPEDKDGTPSYYSFQFKPATFLNYGLKYGVIPATTSPAELSELLKSYDHQREIVSNMIHDKSVNWHQQFPACVRKNGLPPR